MRAEFASLDQARSRIAATWLAPSESATLGSVTLLPHQIEAVQSLRRALTTWGGALLADEVGLGKTYTALAVARSYNRVVVVLPAALRTTWHSALERAHGHAALWSYEQLSRRKLPPGRPDLVIFDEAHHLRNRSCQRYAHAANLSWGSRVLLLSATPVHNHGADLTSLLALFVNVDAQRDIDLVRQAIVVRRSYQDVAVAMPCVRAVQWARVPSAPKVAEAILALPIPALVVDHPAVPALARLTLLRQWSSSDAALHHAIRKRLVATMASLELLERGLPVTKQFADDIIPGLDALQLPLFGAAGVTPTVNRDALLAFADALRHLRDLLRANATDHLRFEQLRSLIGDRRTVVFTHSVHTAVAAFRGLASYVQAACLTGASAQIASGRVSRAWVLDRFLNASADAREQIQVLVATDVLSEGVNLQRASLLVHLDLPWTATRLRQRLGRLRRIGAETNAIDVVAFQSRESAIDRHVIERLRAKAAQHDVLLSWEDCEGLLDGDRDAGAGAALSAEVELRQLLARWHHGDGSEMSDGCAVAAARSPWVGWIAAGTCDSGAFLALSRDGVVTTDAGEILRALRDDLRENVDHPCPSHVKAALDAAHHYASSMTALGPLQCAPTAIQREVIRRLRMALAASPRARRAEFGVRIDSIESLVQRAVGAGADFAITQWLQAQSDPIQLEQLDGLHALLAPHAWRPHPAPPTVTALILATNRLSVR